MEIIWSTLLNVSINVGISLLSDSDLVLVDIVHHSAAET